MREAQVPLFFITSNVPSDNDYVVYLSQEYCLLEEKNPKEERDCVANIVATYNPSCLIFTSTILFGEDGEEQGCRGLKPFSIFWCTQSG